MTLKLHNTLTKQLETFTPQSGSAVSLYTCGPTVYGRLHVGNWAAYIYWDILVRTLLVSGYDVERVMNITDVGHLVSDADDGEDKLEKGARREGKTAWEIAEFYTADFIDGMKQLGLLTPEHIVKATDYIPQQLELVRTLAKKGYTYQIDDGIYFDTSKFPDYASFAHLDLSAQRAGARVESNSQKKNPSDFALWKFTPAGETRDMQWETPADLMLGEVSGAMGFPGWHLECSAMAMTILGDTIDIHTGGIDHIPVHHTNEIAQSQSASGQLFSRFWLHNNHMKVDGTKISKSLGNGYTLQDLVDRGFEPLDLRMYVLQGHYSSEGNFTFENLTAAKNRRHNWRNAAALRHQIHDTLSGDAERAAQPGGVSLLAVSGALIEAISVNLNTPGVLRIIDEAFARLESSALPLIYRHGLIHALETIDELLGLQLLATSPDITDECKQLLLQRQRARDDKDWVTSDTLRDELLTHGVAVRDSAAGTIWGYN